MQKQTCRYLTRFVGFFFGGLAISLTSCGSENQVDLSSVPDGLELREAAALGDSQILVSGRVTINGEVPTPDIEWIVKNDPYCAKYKPIKTKRWRLGENEALGDVVVAIVGQSGKSIDTRPAGMDQHGCCYTPHVVAIAEGEGVVFTNSDQTFHNVRVDRHQQGTMDRGTSIKNYGQPAGSKNLHLFPSSGVYRVQCDLHRWMRAWVYVHDSGFYGVTNEDGEFTIRGELPDGDYEVLAWHSEFPEPLKGALNISNGSAKIDFEFSAADAMIPGSKGK